MKFNLIYFNLDDAIFFVKKVAKYFVYLLMYVDDILMIGNNESYISSIKKELKIGFEMKYLGYIHHYLGIEFAPLPKYIFISQKNYTKEFFNKFGMDERNPISTPME